MSTIYPPIVTQQIPESILAATLEYLGNLARNPRYPMPDGGYHLVHSRKNAASIKSHILRAIHPMPPAGSGWEYRNVATIYPIPFGHHLVLCPLNSESQPISWLNEAGVPLRCWADGALSDAAEVANRLVDYLDAQEEAARTGIKWARSIASSDGHSARRESIHVHIILTPCLEILKSVGLQLQPFVWPRIIMARDE